MKVNNQQSKDVERERIRVIYDTYMYDNEYVFCITQSYVHPYIFPWTLPLIQISLNGSIWSTVSVTLERYITVVHPR